MKKTVPKSGVEINENFGLALKQYDLDNNSELVTVKMRAIREFQEKKSFAEELMIFYVAFTRAKNRIYLFGTDKSYKKFTLRDCDSYFDLIFYALKLEAEQFEGESLQICKIGQICEEDVVYPQSFENLEVDQEIYHKIEKYFSYKYKYDESKNFRLKESVTSLNQKNQEEEISKFSNDDFSFGSSFVEIGNAYHTALKVLNFEKIFDLDSLKSEIEIKSNIFNPIENLIDLNVLLKNILILKQFSQDAKVFKEKEFILKESISNLLKDEVSDDEILVQGVIDFFAIKNNKLTLIDYKYSNSTNDDYLINKYKNQLKIYKIALEKVLNVEKCEVYLLSLKNQKLIKLENV